MHERGVLDAVPQLGPGRSQKPKKPQRPRRVPPLGLPRTIGQYAQYLGDNPKYIQSDITRATKIYLASQQIFAGFDNGEFRKHLEAAYAAACRMEQEVACLTRPPVLATRHIRSQKRPFSPSHVAGTIRLFSPSSQGLAACRKGMVVSITTAFPSVPQVNPPCVQVRPVFTCYDSISARPGSVSPPCSAKGPATPLPCL
jgi:hypothetical protein